jgi:UDP-glucose 4-epimerase
MEGDFSNHEDIKKAIAGMDIIFHLVSTTLPKSSNDNPVYDISSNVISTIHMLEGARSAGIRKVIFFSSGGTVYGIPRKVPIPEDHPTEPTCSYGIHKLMIEKYLALYFHLYGIDYTIIRVANPYGERQRPTGAQGAIGVFLYKAMRGEPIEIWGDGSVVRDYIHIEDVARAAILAIEGEVPDRVVNIGSGCGLKLNDMIEGIATVTECSIDVRYSAARSFDVPVNVLDISRAMTYLKWRPEIDLLAGLSRTAACMRRQLSSAVDIGV